MIRQMRIYEPYFSIRRVFFRLLSTESNTELSVKPPLSGVARIPVSRTYRKPPAAFWGILYLSIKPTDRDALPSVIPPENQYFNVLSVIPTEI